MDHVVCLDEGANELENLVKGNKSMILRGSDVKDLPYGNVYEGDTLYFISSLARERSRQEEMFHLSIIQEVIG